jgi:hypothetical protein
MRIIFVARHRGLGHPKVFVKPATGKEMSMANPIYTITTLLYGLRKCPINGINFCGSESYIF